MTAAAHALISSWRRGSDREQLLQVVQPSLVGLIDGTISTLAPIFAAAYLAGSRAALLVGPPRSQRRSAWASRRRSPTTARSPAAAGRWRADY